MSALTHYRNHLTALALAYRANVACLIWGNPGEGKSALIDALADALGIYSEVVVASLRDPTDLNGLPVTQADGSVRLAPPAWLTASNAQDGSLIVFDEITTAPPATRAAALRVVNERVSADTPLNPQTRIVAIANPPEVAEDGWELGAPMSNRFFHLRGWELPVEAFTAGLTTGVWEQAPALDIDPRRLERELADARSAVAGFLHGHPDLLRDLPDHPDAHQYAWPSPRTWTMCATLLGYAHAADVSDDVIALIADGTVGPIAAPAFLQFLAALTLPSPQELLDDPAGWDVPQRGDLTYAILARLISHLAAADTDRDAWKSAGDAIAHAAETQGDVAVAVAATWWQHAKQFGPTVMPKALTNGRFANVIRHTQTA